MQAQVERHALPVGDDDRVAAELAAVEQFVESGAAAALTAYVQRPPRLEVTTTLGNFQMHAADTAWVVQELWTRVLRAAREQWPLSPALWHVAVRAAAATVASLPVAERQGPTACGVLTALQEFSKLQEVGHAVAAPSQLAVLQTAAAAGFVPAAYRLLQWLLTGGRVEVTEALVAAVGAAAISTMGLNFCDGSVHAAG